MKKVHLYLPALNKCLQDSYKSHARCLLPLLNFLKTFLDDKITSKVLNSYFKVWWLRSDEITWRAGNLSPRETKFFRCLDAGKSPIWLCQHLEIQFRHLFTRKKHRVCLRYFWEKKLFLSKPWLNYRIWRYFFDNAILRWYQVNTFLTPIL